MDLLNEKLGETGMTDYQTKILLAAITDMLDSSADINEARIRFASIIGGGFTSAKSTVAMCTDNAEVETDFQYKATIEMIYQILKANFEAGKSPEEVLAIIATLKNEGKE